ncbi:hypothetical protein D9M69_723080 [compost metagenome]
MHEADHCVTDLEYSSRAAGVVDRLHLHLATEAEPADSFGTVYLDRLPIRLGDDLHYGSRAGPDVLAHVLVEFRAHVDTANDTFQST